MKIWTSRYELVPVGSVGLASAAPREGALLRVEFPGQGTGYADVHPWVELGDLSLGEQLSRVKQGRPSHLGKRSLDFARLDAEARSEGSSLWDGIELPPSQAWVSQARGLGPQEVRSYWQKGFTRIKVKVGQDPISEARHLRSLHECMSGDGLKLRLDFNSRLTAEGLERFWEDLGVMTAAIDFIEDPFPYDGKVWRRFQTYGVRLALDRLPLQTELEPGSFSVWVVKPAIQTLEECEPQAQALGVSEFVITSYLDHAFGQLCAVWQAARWREQFGPRVGICGLHTHVAYRSDAFFKQIQVKGPYLQRPPGRLGFGWENELERLEWVPL